MKNVTLEQYKPQTDDIHFRVLGTGDIYTVDCGSKGNLIVMEEPQYQVMLDALQTMFAAASMGDKAYETLQAAMKKAGLKSTN